MYKLHWAPNTGAFAPDVVMNLAGAPFDGPIAEVRIGRVDGGGAGPRGAAATG